jgi:hypothetical protein
MFTPKGKFSWYELMTSDTQAAGKFYSDVVGWTTQEMPGGGGPPYTVFNADGVGMAGMLTIPGHTAWIGYISVDDVDAHIEKIVDAGGTLWRPATDIPGMLRFAVMGDPQGAAIVVFTPNPNMPSPVRPVPPASGTIGWNELYTTDLDGAFAFYSKMFGWTKISDMDMGPMGLYRIFDEGENKQMGDGGMMNKMPDMPVACWNFTSASSQSRQLFNGSNPAGAKSSMGPGKYPAVDGSSTRRTRWGLCSLSSPARNERFRPVAYPWGRTLTRP